jgi:hypothetical protein
MFHFLLDCFTAHVPTEDQHFNKDCVTVYSANLVWNPALQTRVRTGAGNHTNSNQSSCKEKFYLQMAAERNNKTTVFF